MRYNVVNKLLTSLKPVNDVYSLAVATANQQRYEWAPIKTVLLTTFAKRENLIIALRQSITDLKYSSVDKLCTDARRIFAMHMSIFGATNPYELRTFVEALVAKLPGNRPSLVITEVHNILGFHGFSADWALSLPFDGDNSSILGVITKIERQEAAVKLMKHTQSDRVLVVEDAPAKPVMIVNSDTRPKEAQSPDTLRTSAVKSWCEKHSPVTLIKVYSLWGEQLKEKVPEMDDSFALKAKGRKFPIFRIVALKVDNAGERDRVLQRLKSSNIRAEAFAPFQ
ncbi:hypothetical protein Pmar_PMAR010502 [Perkinsus marinus ATCC 50983]|uniref:Uncharacterized protein n=1 Tax=Perkinsus marinus (strain ATCC 50983 / TXsc) TaxID=423536 RepID=C5KQ50_PERM5|nr:hypothetical protein Pmar_PMAR010502 [Perkinsus marinus ATCC 50983]EER13405.1 hypothetical protein Pmar_PMAR010502 [Perkinsus marinus ATCC 50983]|eukprot:XP_002781610.1 hypothetical protein Pmar_PMAR010502 [Perkinsus marinus ATCC 50983]